MEDAQPFADARYPPQQIHESLARTRPTQEVDGRREARRQQDEQHAAVGLHQPTPFQQQARHGRQAVAQILVDAAEARNDVAEQEEDHQAADGNQERRIDRRRDQLAAQCLDLLPISHVTAQGLRQVAGPFARPHDGDIERREDPRLGLQGRGKGLALAQPTEHPFQDRTRAGTPLLFGQGGQGLHDTDPGLEQGEHFLAEQEQGKPAIGRAGQAPPEGRRADIEDCMPLLAHLARRIFRMHRLDQQDTDPVAFADGFHLVEHARVVTSW